MPSGLANHGAGMLGSQSRIGLQRTAPCTTFRGVVPRPYRRVRRSAVLERWDICGAANDGAPPANDVGLLALTPTDDDPPVRADETAIFWEIITGVGTLTEGEIEGIAAAARQAMGGSPCAYPGPKKLARANDIDVRPVPGLPCSGLYLPNQRPAPVPPPPGWIRGTALYRPDEDQRAEGGVLYHEIGHALTPAGGNHVDTSRIGLAMSIGREEVIKLVRKYGAVGAVRVLCAKHRHAPRRLLRLRVERILLVSERA